MSILNRLKKIEDRVEKENINHQVVWDFSQTTTEQLLKLKSLIIEGGGEAADYTRELMNGGYLSRHSSGGRV